MTHDFNPASGQCRRCYLTLTEFLLTDAACGEMTAPEPAAAPALPDQCRWCGAAFFIALGAHERFCELRKETQE